MRVRKETAVHNAFSIDTIVTVYYLKREAHTSDVVQGDNRIYDFWQLVYVDGGDYAFSVEDKLFRLCPGQLFLAEPGVCRVSRAHGDAEVVIISFRCSSDKMNALKNKIIDLSKNEKKVLSDILTYGLEKFTLIDDDEYFGQQLKDGTTDYELQLIKNNLELLFIMLYERNNSVKKNALSARNYDNYYKQQLAAIENYFKENLCKAITVEELSENIGMSTSTIKRVCKRQLGSGAIYYFITLKIEEAKRLIRETDMNLTQISERLGFSSVHYFSRIFKARTGVSPRAYAKSVIKN